VSARQVKVTIRSREFARLDGELQVAASVTGEDIRIEGASCRHCGSDFYASQLTVRETALARAAVQAVIEAVSEEQA